MNYFDDYKINGIATYNNKKYIFFKNKVIHKNKFKINNHDCKINQKNKIICYNDEYIVRFK